MTDQNTGEFIRIQTTLAGRYSLERELGRGGMGIVYLARDVALDRLVALKLLPPQMASEPALRQRFLNEARTAARLSHPNIVPIFSVDEVGDLVFFVMAFVDGETLGQRVRARGPVPPSELARILREVAWGLAYAHAQGVVHRDVKADNILIERGSGRALVADFGIARITQNAGVTRAGEILGTAEYMSPEQASGEAVDHRSDIYSLGVVAFYALAGRLPFEGASVGAVLAKQITQPAPPIAEACEGVPRKLAQAVDRCLEKDPAGRFTNAEELADAISLSLDARRELPVPIRVFIKNSTGIGQNVVGASCFLVCFTLVGASLALFRVPGWLEFLLVSDGIALLGQTALGGALLYEARTLLKSGYSRADLSVAWNSELEREREERAFEFGRTASLVERVARWMVPLGLVSWIVGVFGIGSFRDADYLFTFGIITTTISGVTSLWRYSERTGLSGRLMGKFLSTRAGRWVFGLAGLGLKRSAIAAPATHRHTELAIGMAVDTLFDALPKPARQQLAELPSVVRALEADAMKIRRRVDELNDVAAKVESGKRAEPGRPAGDALIARRASLDHDLQIARDAARQRLADAVTALESIRLNLLRLTAGAGSVDSLTADLAAAREVSEEVGRLLEARGEVEAQLSNRASG